MSNIIDTIASVGILISNIFYNFKLSILLPLLIYYIKENKGTPYYIIILNPLISAIVFGIIYIMGNCDVPDYIEFDTNRSKKKLLIISGLFNTLSNILILYTSELSRVSILLQIIILTSNVFITDILIKYFTYRNLKIINGYTITSIIMMIGTFMIPIIYQIITNNFNKYDILWIILNISGIVSKSISILLHEKYIEENVNNLKTQLEMTIINNTLQTIICIAIINMDWIPIIGYSQKKGFIEVSKNTINLFFEGKSITVIVIGIAYTLSYIGNQLNNIFLSITELKNKYYMNPRYVSIITPISVIILYTVATSINYGIKYPLYINIIVMLMIIISLIIWNKYKVSNNTLDKQINAVIVNTRNYNYGDL